MKRLSEYKDRDALDKLVDIIDPLRELMADKEFLECIAKQDAWGASAVAAKNHPDTCMRFLAAIDGTPVEEYHCGVMALPMRMIEILSDKEVYTGFLSPEEVKKPATSSGSATENTEEGGN